LVTQREKDVDFEWEKALATTGDSGVYLQYAHARCASIMRRGEVTVRLDELDTTPLTHDLEWAVGKRLLEFGDTVVRAGDHCEPHLICHYLLELAGDFARWYTAGNGDPSLRVLCEDLAQRHARVALTAAVQRTIATGLGLLGVPHPDQM
ncbi:MAG: DALR anticodon-binding domain-containing protein, partial [Proteobacteria bacterium]|nr:DALR anticodon-binding domain-containing protein [Pseudomonadota bacterium]